MAIAKRKSTASAHPTHAILLSVADDSGSRDKSIEQFLEFLRIRQPQVSVNAVYVILQRITGVYVRARYADPRPGDVRHSLADISLARDLLGFAPAVPIEEGLRRTVAWQREQASRTPSM